MATTNNGFKQQQTTTTPEQVPLATTRRQRYCPMAVANAFILHAQQEAVDIGLLQLIKWVYLAHGWGLVLLDRSLLDEAPEAWTYGPMYPTLYY